MKNIFSNPLFHLAIVLFLVLGIEGYYSVAALSPPFSQPPLNTGYPPLDTGSTTQTKIGSLYIGNTSTNAVGIINDGSLEFWNHVLSDVNGGISKIFLNSQQEEPVIYNYKYGLFGNYGLISSSTFNSGWDYRNDDGLLYYNSGNIGIGKNFNPTALVSVGNSSSSLDFVSFATTTVLGSLLGGYPYYTFAIGSNIVGSNYPQYSGYPPLLSTNNISSAIFYTNNPIYNYNNNLGLSGFIVGGQGKKGIMFNNKDASVSITGTLTAGTISAVAQESNPDLPDPSRKTTIPAGKYTWGVSSSTCYVDNDYYRNEGPIKVYIDSNNKIVKGGYDKDKQCVLVFPGATYNAKCPRGYFMTGIRFGADSNVVLECHTLFPYNP